MISARTAIGILSYFQSFEYFEYVLIHPISQSFLEKKKQESRQVAVKVPI